MDLSEKCRSKAVGKARMSQFANSSFDPETVIVLRGAVDRAWCALAPDRQTVQNRDLIAGAIIQSASEGERDLVLLSDFALSTLCLEARHGAL
jgi:hypothetical protein